MWGRRGIYWGIWGWRPLQGYRVHVCVVWPWTLSPKPPHTHTLPQGYRVLGCVVWPAMHEPPVGLVRCVRRDLVRQLKAAHALRPGPQPLWQGAASCWRCRWVGLEKEESRVGGCCKSHG